MNPTLRVVLITEPHKLGNHARTEKDVYEDIQNPEARNLNSKINVCVYCIYIYAAAENRISSRQSWRRPLAPCSTVRGTAFEKKMEKGTLNDLLAKRKDPNSFPNLHTTRTGCCWKVPPRTHTNPPQAGSFSECARSEDREQAPLFYPRPTKSRASGAFRVAAKLI